MAIELPELVGKKEQVSQLLDMLKKFFDTNGKITIKVDRTTNNKAIFPITSILGFNVNVSLEDPTEITYEFRDDVCYVVFSKPALVNLGSRLVQQPVNAVQISLDRIYFDIPRFLDAYINVR